MRWTNAAPQPEGEASAVLEALRTRGYAMLPRDALAQRAARLIEGLEAALRERERLDEAVALIACWATENPEDVSFSGADACEWIRRAMKPGAAATHPRRREMSDWKPGWHVKRIEIRPGYYGWEFGWCWAALLFGFIAFFIGALAWQNL